MYQFREERLDEIKKFKINHIAEKVGISRVYLSYIIHNKNKCKKAVAYGITKAFDETKEIEYYFIEK